MLEKLEARQQRLNLSLRALAAELSVSPTLLSLVLNRKRPPSKNLQLAIQRWLTTPIVTSHPNGPGTMYRSFIAERESHLSPRTITFYREKLAPFITWCEAEDVADIRDVRRSNVAQFLSAIRKGRTGRPLNNGALKLHHQVLRTFFKYVGETCGIDHNPVGGLKVKHSDAQTMEYSDTEVAQMRTVVASHTDPTQRLRNQAILTVLLNSGMRAAELLAMRVRDLNEDGAVKVTGKGSKDRVVSIGSSGLTAIKEYLDARDKDAEHIWLTPSGDPLKYSGLKSMLDRIEQADTVFTDGVYPHRFRHTAITRLLRARVPLRSVQRYAGHTDPQTTLRYAQALDADEAIAEVAEW